MMAFADVGMSPPVERSITVSAPVVNGGVQLLELFFYVGGDGGVADVGVDLAERLYADRHGLEFGMVDVCGDDHAARDDSSRTNSGVISPVSDVLHFLGDYSATRLMHLREVASVFSAFRLASPLCPRLRTASKSLLLPFAPFFESPLPTDIFVCTILHEVLVHKLYAALDAIISRV